MQAVPTPFATIRPQKGHSLFELNVKTGIISNIQANLTAAGSNRKKLITQPHCLYITALNKKNAAKHFTKMLISLNKIAASANKIALPTGEG